MSKGLQYSGHSYPHWLKKSTISSGCPQNTNSPRLMMAILLNNWGTNTHPQFNFYQQIPINWTTLSSVLVEKKIVTFKEISVICHFLSFLQFISKHTLKSSERGWWMVTMTIRFLLASSASSTTIWLAVMLSRPVVGSSNRITPATTSPQWRHHLPAGLVTHWNTERHER